MLINSFLEECKYILKNRMTLIVLFILPLLTVILIGIELDKEVIDDIPMAVIDYDNSTFSRQLVDSFDQNEIFDIISYPSSEEELEILMRDSLVRVGMILPEGFYDDISALKSPTVLMLYDGSHMSITSASKSKAMEILLTYKAGATIKQLTARLGISYEEALNIAQAFQFKNRVLYNPLKSYEDFLAPILLAGCVQIAIVLTSTVSVSHDIYLRSRNERLGYATGKAVFYTLCGSLSFILCIFVQVGVFNMPFKGSIVDALILSIGLSLSVSSFCILISSLMRIRMVALIAGAVVFIPNSIMAGTTWPLSSMPVGYQGFAKYMPFAHYVNNIRDIYLKGTSLQQLGGEVTYLFAFGIITMIMTELVMLLVGQDTSCKEVGDDDFHRDFEERVSVDI